MKAVYLYNRYAVWDWAYLGRGGLFAKFYTFVYGVSAVYLKHSLREL